MSDVDAIGAAIAGLCGFAGFCFWPWDWRGRRRQVTLRRERRPWE